MTLSAKSVFSSIDNVDCRPHSTGLQPKSETGRCSSVTVSADRRRPCEGNWLDETEGALELEVNENKQGGSAVN